MFVQGFVVPVKAESQDAYRQSAEKFWPIIHDYGAIEHVEAWEADVSDGKQTDFRRSVDLQDGEKVVFAWVMWPDKETADAGQAKMMEDPRMDELDMANMPFDMKRMIYGGFEPIVEQGGAGGSYIDGFVVPVPNDKREAYRQMAATAAPIFMEYGALRDIEAWGSDVPKGEQTDFYRSVQAGDEESVVFSFVEWPDEATRNEGWKKIMEDPRMKPPGDMPFDGARMIWGGFKPIMERGR